MLSQPVLGYSVIICVFRFKQLHVTTLNHTVKLKNVYIFFVILVPCVCQAGLRWVGQSEFRSSFNFEEYSCNMAACLAQSEKRTKQIHIFVLSGQKLQQRINKYISLYQTPGIKK